MVDNEKDIVAELKQKFLSYKTTAEKIKEDEQLYFQFKKYILLEKFSKEVANINDEDILSAIKCHTTGKPNMNLLEKIVYVSDYIEPLRYKMPRLDVIRKTAFEDIDECLKLILTDTLNYLKSSGMMIDKATIDTYSYYCKLSEREHIWVKLAQKKTH